MLHAVLHHKLDETIPEPQRLEDALTSAVFGTLVMTEACDVLTAWLSCAKHVDGTREQVQARCIDGIWFWPRLALAEPDLVLQLGNQLFIVEAKYHSGRHDSAGAGGYTTDGEPPITDQLHRQWQSMNDSATGYAGYPDDLQRAIATCRIALIYLVDGRRSRRAWYQFRESADRLPRNADIRLLTWQSLHEVIASTGPSRQSPRWHRALCDYLSLLGLEGFVGLRTQLRGHVSDFTLATHWLSQRLQYTALDLFSAICTRQKILAASQAWMINTTGTDQIDFVGAINPFVTERKSVQRAAMALTILSSSPPYTHLPDFRHEFYRMTNRLQAASTWRIKSNNGDHHE